MGGGLKRRRVVGERGRVLNVVKTGRTILHKMHEEQMTMEEGEAERTGVEGDKSDNAGGKSEKECILGTTRLMIN